MSMVLRDRQLVTVKKVMNEFKEVNSTVIVCPVGFGKTVVFADVIRRFRPMRSIVVAERRELIWQARDRIRQVTGLEAQIEMGELSATNDLLTQAPVVICTVQTLISSEGNNGRRMGRFDPNQFGLLVIDECFPAGTMVSGRPIEQLDFGDEIHTHLGKGKVTGTFKRKTKELIRLTFSDGRRIVCTPNHPIWTAKGFCLASELTLSSMVLTITPYEQTRPLRHLRELPSRYQQALRQSSMQERIKPTHDPRNIPETRRGDNKIPQNKRNARSGGTGKIVGETASHGMEAKDSRRQRQTDSITPTGSCRSVGMGHGGCDPNKRKEGRWISDLLQGGHWQLGFEDCGRSGRWVASLAGSKGQRSKERCVFAFTGLARIEIFQQGSRSGFEELCPDGYVYNLTVSNGNTYFANGVLVHNCHHSTAQSYKDILNYFKKNPDLRILGVTATPDRADEQALGQIFETVADDYEILDAINDGWLVQVEQQIARVKGLDFSDMRTTAGDLNGADLAKEMERESNIQGVVQPILECMYRQEPHSLDSIPTPDWGKHIASLSVEPRRTLVFTVSVAQAEMLSNIFNRVREGMSNWVCGATKEDVRRERLDQFANGKCPVMVNCGVLIEGYDHPEIEIIGMARPTKSRSRYAQMVGRSLRPIPGLVDSLPTAEDRRTAIGTSKKPCATILDFVGNSGRHKLVSSADILGGKVSNEAIERATRWIEKLGKAAPMAQALEQAEKDIKREADEARQAEEARKAKLVAKSRYVMRSVNPFDVLDLQPVKQRGWDDGKRLSEKQRAILQKQGIDPDQLPYSQGRQLLLEIFRRWDKRLCSFGQAKILRRRGLSTEVSREEASRLINEIAAKEHWKPRAERQPA